MSRIPTLDGWRAVAIAAVTFHHLGRALCLTESACDSSLTRYGAFGVDIFFGLSGLLITNLLLSERRQNGTFSLRGFYIRRVFRILPPYLAFLAVITIAGLWTTRWEALSCVLFFRNYLPFALGGESTQHLWSLAVEEHFYLFWPGILFLLGWKRARPAAFLLATAIGIWRMIESQLASPTLPMLPNHFRTDLRLDALLWGCVFAFLLNDQKERAKLAAQLRWPVWLGGVVTWIVCMILYSPLSSVFIALGMPILLLGTLTHPAWLLSRALEWGPIAWLGRISYSLYLWQQIFLVAGWEHPAHWWQRWPANLIASVATAAASYYLIEKPFINAGRRLSSGPSPTLNTQSEPRPQEAIS